MKKSLITSSDPRALVRLNDIMQQAGQAANEAGARHAFDDHTARKADKVNKTQTHEMTADTRKAAGAYFKYDAPSDGILWHRSNKGTGKLSGQLSETSATRALTKRVELPGRHAGIEGLSAHDCRHYDATFEARNGTPINRIMDKFGWNSPAMALRYIEAAHIANEGRARVRPQ